MLKQVLLRILNLRAPTWRQATWRQGVRSLLHFHSSQGQEANSARRRRILILKAADLEDLEKATEEVTIINAQNELYMFYVLYA
jgi:uncharacterized protein YjlB